MAEWFVIPTFIVSVCGLIAAIWAIYHIKEVHILVNSRLSQLLDVVGAAREAIGLKKGEEKSKTDKGEKK